MSRTTKNKGLGLVVTFALMLIFTLFLYIMSKTIGLSMEDILTLNMIFYLMFGISIFGLIGSLIWKAKASIAR